MLTSLLTCLCLPLCVCAVRALVTLLHPSNLAAGSLIHWGCKEMQRGINEGFRVANCGLGNGYEKGMQTTFSLMSAVSILILSMTNVCGALCVPLCRQ